MVKSADAYFLRGVGKHRPVVKINALTWLCKGNTQCEVKYGRIRLTQFYFARRNKGVKTFMQLVFFNAVIVQFFSLVIDGYYAEAAILKA